MPGGSRDEVLKNIARLIANGAGDLALQPQES